jgi:hypothetical protein
MLLACYGKEKTLNTYEYKTYFFGFKYESQEGSTTFERQEVMPDQQLTELGSQGWELVNVIKLTRHWWHGLGAGEKPWGIQYIFKRPKQ